MLSKHFGCHRWVYNWGLDQKTKVYKETGRSINRFDLQKQLPILKRQEDTLWLSEVCAVSLQMSLDHLDKAYVRFFNQKKGFPKFKSKYGKQSYQCYRDVNVIWDKGSIKIPKISPIKASLSRKFSGKQGASTISKSSTGKYYISIVVDDGIDKPELREIEERTTVGIDTGIKKFLTLSDSRTFENNNYLKNSQQRLAILQKRLSKKKKGSNRRQRAKLAVAKLHEKIKNQREDYLHKVTHQLTNKSQVSAYCIEGLNVKGMMSNHKLARALSDVSISRFYEMLKYKCEWNGINVLTIGRFEPSSKMCSKCGNVKKELSLSERVYNCSECGYQEDRDVNAALNVKSMALHPKNIQAENQPVSTGSCDQ